MMTSERRRQLLELLAREGRLVAVDESRRLGVSEDTIRRDLRELAAEGRLKRVHGGALPASPALADFPSRLPIAPQAKERIGRRAAALIQDGQVVFLDGGTTAVQVARHLPRELAATIVTHSPSIALELQGHARLTVELVGGRLYRHSVVAVGAETLRQLDRFLPDLCFIGATGAHEQHGLTTGDAEEAHVKRAVIERSGEANVLLSPEKIGAVSPFVIAGWSAIDRAICDRAPDAFRAGLSRQGCELLD